MIYKKTAKVPTDFNAGIVRVAASIFQREYLYNARKQSIYEKIIDLTLNSSGVRDIGRILKIL